MDGEWDEGQIRRYAAHQQGMNKGRREPAAGSIGEASFVQRPLSDLT